MRVISWGGGVQSSVLVWMAALGDIDPVDAVIHADTTHERSATYEYIARQKPLLEARGMRVVTVQAKGQRIKVNYHVRAGSLFIPAYTATNGNGGQLRRQCTSEWKVLPIRRWLQANRNKQPVTMLLGISLDEWHRAKDADVKYITNQFPLLDMKLTRNDCVNWLERHGLEVPGKSSCTFCPYHNKRAWQDMKRNNGPDWEKAVEVDEAIRKVRPPYDLFVHSSRIPLVDVDLSTPEDHGQLRLLNEECDSGFCWT